MFAPSRHCRPQLGTHRMMLGLRQIGDVLRDRPYTHPTLRPDHSDHRMSLRHMFCTRSLCLIPSRSAQPGRRTCQHRIDCTGTYQWRPGPSCRCLRHTLCMIRFPSVRSECRRIRRRKRCTSATQSDFDNAQPCTHHTRFVRSPNTCPSHNQRTHQERFRVGPVRSLCTAVVLYQWSPSPCCS